MSFKKTIIIFTIIILSISSIAYAAEEASFSTFKTILKLFSYVIIFILVIVLTNYGTKLIATNSRKFINSKYMKVIDKININTNVKLEIVEINNKMYILAVTNDTIEIIDKIPIEKFELKENVKTQDELHKHFYNDNNYGKIQKKLDSMFLRSNKSIDKEDKNNEKNC